MSPNGREEHQVYRTCKDSSPDLQGLTRTAAPRRGRGDTHGEINSLLGPRIPTTGVQTPPAFKSQPIRSGRLQGLIGTSKTRHLQGETGGDSP
jgi:hypothetical protein